MTNLENKINNENNINNNEIWLIKLLAFLHDPLNKVENLVKHEENAKKLNKILINDYENLLKNKKDIIKRADEIASAASRIILEGLEQKIYVNYNETKFIDIFTLQEYDINFPKFDEISNFFKKLSDIKNKKENETKDEPNYYRDLFFLLWRFVPDYFGDKYDIQKNKIDYNPADTRAPNHSLYDHLIQTSAIASSLDKICFLLVSLSPVQKFIENSRKTSDLFSSSFLLSFLVFRIILKIIEIYGPDSIIYPNMLRQPLLDKFIFKKLLKKYELSELEKYLRIDEDSITIANIPNKFLAIIPFSNSIVNTITNTFNQELKNLALKVEQNIQNNTKIEASEISNKIYQDLKDYFNLNIVLLPMYNFQKDEKNYKDKVNNALSDYKILVKYGCQNGNNELVYLVEKIMKFSQYKTNNLGNVYPVLVKLAEKLLNVKKTVKKMNFIELKGNKCNLCGIYEILNLDWKKLYKNHIVLDNEKLCGICLTKRIFPKIYPEIIGLNVNLNFPSVSEISVIFSKRELFKNTQLRDIILKFIKKLKELGQELNYDFFKSQTVPKLQKEYENHELKDLLKLDGQLLMEESFSNKYLKNEYGFENINEKYLQEIKYYLKEIQKSIKIQKYYAILQVDGDNMGKWLEGKYNPKIGKVIAKKIQENIQKIDNCKEILELNHVMSPSIHGLFSRKLSEFALSKVKDIVENDCYGKLVYAGGDDLLALLPIDTVFKCAYFIVNAFKSFLGENATMSSGILITHCKYPFYLALQKVRELEKNAKRNYLNKKNSFAIGLLTHSGAYRQFSYTWDLLDSLLNLIKYFKEDKIPANLPYQYLYFVNSIYDNNPNIDFSELSNIFKTELQRLLYHKKLKAKDSKMIDFILNLYEMIINPKVESLENSNQNEKNRRIFYFTDLLIITNKLASVIISDDITLI